MSKVGIKELATILAKKRKLDSEAALAFVESFFDVLCDSLRDEKMVKVKGLGTFKVVPVSARKSVDVNSNLSRLPAVTRFPLPQIQPFEIWLTAHLRSLKP